VSDRLKIEPITKLFKQDLAVVNLGLTSFGENLEANGTKVIQVAWKPPASGNEAMIKVLDRIERSNVDVTAANKMAIKIILKGKPILA